MKVNLNDVVSGKKMMSKTGLIITAVVGIVVLSLLTRGLYNKVFEPFVNIILLFFPGGKKLEMPFIAALIFGIIVWMPGYLSRQINGARIYALVISFLALTIFRIPIFMKAHVLLYILMLIIMLGCFYMGGFTNNVCIKNDIVGFLVGGLGSFLICWIYSILAIFMTIPLFGAGKGEIVKMGNAALPITVIAHIVSLALIIIKNSAKNKNR